MLAFINRRAERTYPELDNSACAWRCRVCGAPGSGLLIRPCGSYGYSQAHNRLVLGVLLMKKLFIAILFLLLAAPGWALDIDVDNNNATDIAFGGTLTLTPGGGTLTFTIGQ